VNALLVDLQFFPKPILFKELNKYSHVVFEQYENFQKMSFRNRCMIAGAEGRIMLSIPLLGGRDQKTLMKDIRIDNMQNWQSNHWKTISSCYNRSPWFEHYQDELSALYKTKTGFLVDWNLKCFEWALSKLGFKVNIELSQAYLKEPEGSEITDWRNQLRPNSEHSGDGSIRYRQVFEERTGFLPGLSILDLLFCEGIHASKKLQN
jgi:hypothetical protein